ncbi:MAG TPA: biopolymer transporter Tol [Amnibacterium sp.]|jgi:Tol biopolymer transport system component|nr:biopolymer transporter Tol [Amnibacterium sp.]
MPYRELAPGQSARIHVHDAATGEDVVVHEATDVLFEAPNWSVDGEALLINGRGLVWSLAPETGATPQRIEFQGLPEVNNDHVLDPSGDAIYLSAMDGHIYHGALAGGSVRKVTSDEGVWHFLHGVSPDGERLAYVRITTFDQPGLLTIMPAAGGESSVVDTGAGHIDGPEWSPDGRWIYFNSEHWASEPGHAQIARIPDGGGEVERLVSSGTVDWFPHLAPDGRTAVYLEFPPGTLGHPADREVTLVVVRTDDWATPVERIPLPGGQGTINVNSWAPDSRRFAYVSYPTAAS